MARKKTLTEAELLAELSAACTAAGGQVAWATKAGVSQSYVSDVLRKRQAPGDAILRALGYERKTVTIYEAVPDIWERNKRK